MTGIDDLVELLTLEKKRDLQRYTSGLIIRSEDLADFIAALDQYPFEYRHFFQRREMPNRLAPTEEGLAGFREGAPSGDRLASVKRVSQFFQERQVLYGHMLCTRDLSRWHSCTSASATWSRWATIGRGRGAILTFTS